MMRILSLGWGVQSWTIAAMVAKGELPPIDYAVHADTTWERASTYAFAAQWTPWLEEHRVKVRTVQSDRVKVLEYWQGPAPGVMIPAFTLSENGSKGQLRRQCTHDWKIVPIRRFAAAALRDRGLRKSSGAVTTVMGISQDEWYRMRESDVQYVTHEYPLVQRRITRQDCFIWLEHHGLPAPHKSACVFCPYQSKAMWKGMGRVGGEDWETAVRIDRAIRHKRDNFPLFVHPSRRPLEDAIQDDGQLAMWPEAGCDSGVCFT